MQRRTGQNSVCTHTYTLVFVLFYSSFLLSEYAHKFLVYYRPNEWVKTLASELRLYALDVCVCMCICVRMLGSVLCAMEYSIDTLLPSATNLHGINMNIVECAYL